MRAYKVNTTVQNDGTVSLRDLPFNPGEKIEVIVLTGNESGATASYPLRAQTPYHFDEPFQPAVASEDWDAAK